MKEENAQQEETLKGYNIFFNEISPLVDKFVQTAESLTSEQEQHDEALVGNRELHQYVSSEILPENQSEETWNALNHIKGEIKMPKSDGLGRSTLLGIIAKNHLGSFIGAGTLKLITVTCIFGSSWLIDALSTSLKTYHHLPNTESIEANSLRKQIYLISGGLAVNFLALIICDSQYTLRIKRLSSQLRLYLQATIYAHALVKKCYSSPEQLQGGENQNLVSTVYANLNNLITIDVDTIINFVISFHETWSLVLKLIIGLVMLYFRMHVNSQSVWLYIE